MIEFEQIYDEYINLTNNDEDLDREMISLSKLLSSIIFTVEEKEAIINGELTTYLQRLEMQEIQQLIESSQSKITTKEARSSLEPEIQDVTLEATSEKKQKALIFSPTDEPQLQEDD